MTSPPRHAEEWFSCPHCGARVAVGAKFCRQCGASADSGWNEDSAGEADDYTSDDDFDYDDFVRREFPEHAPVSSLSAKRVLWIVVVLLVAAMFLLLMLRG